MLHVKRIEVKTWQNLSEFLRHSICLHFHLFSKVITSNLFFEFYTWKAWIYIADFMPILRSNVTHCCGESTFLIFHILAG
nr:hypothetical protein CFP56_52355 [Quercus suber]